MADVVSYIMITEEIHDRFIDTSMMCGFMIFIFNLIIVFYYIFCGVTMLFANVFISFTFCMVALKLFFESCKTKLTLASLVLCVYIVFICYIKIVTEIEQVLYVCIIGIYCIGFLASFFLFLLEKKPSRSYIPKFQIITEVYYEIKINSVNIRKFKNEECCICCCHFQINDYRKYLQCNHFFHSNCINNWFEINASCPICRRQFIFL
jgi:hypothetical protein